MTICAETETDLRLCNLKKAGEEKGINRHSKHDLCSLQKTSAVSYDTTCRACHVCLHVIHMLISNYTILDICIIYKDLTLD
jgi:hypothetical protein